MLAAISPADINYEETLSTLRYINEGVRVQSEPTLNIRLLPVFLQIICSKCPYRTNRQEL